MNRPPFPPGFRQRHRKIHMHIRRDGAWDWETTGLDAGTPDDVLIQLRDTTQGIIDAAEHEAAAAAVVPADEPTRSSDIVLSSKMPVRLYAKRWLLDRRERGLKSVDDDETRITKHVLKTTVETPDGVVEFGALSMAMVRPMLCRAVLRSVTKKELAPKTVLNIDAAASQLFADAVADEVITANPWQIPKKEKPKKRDGDPKWRATAKFSIDEMKAILWADDDDAPWDRRAFYALCYFGALRFGEAAALRWGDRIIVNGMPALHIHTQYSTERGEEDETKTESVRLMPEHPVLTLILEAWREGFKQYFGRDPIDTDLIAPSRRGVNRSSSHMINKLHEDLDRLKLRRRRQHDFRRSLIGHCVDAGATRDRLKPGTHGRGSSVLEMYDSPEWATCYEQVLKLRFDYPEQTQSMGTVWGRLLKTGENSGSGAKEWRGGRDLNPGESSRRFAARPSNSAHLAIARAALERPIATDRNETVPTVPKAAAALLDACGGDLSVAIAALHAAMGRRVA